LKEFPRGSSAVGVIGPNVNAEAPDAMDRGELNDARVSTCATMETTFGL
jgi:hypothetical protein